MTLVTSFDAFDARGRRIVVHSWSGKLCVGRTSAAMRLPQCVGRNASTERRPQCGRLCTGLYFFNLSVNDNLTNYHQITVEFIQALLDENATFNLIQET